MQTYAADGILQIVGASSSAYTWWTVGGRDYGRNPYGGWQNTVVDPTNPSGTAVGGGHGGSYQYFGFAVDLVNIIEKGKPIGWDAMNYGRGEIIFGLGDDVGGGHGVFSDMAAQNDVSTNRWGLFQVQGTGYLWKGLMSFGTDGAACWFEDSNVAITVDDTPATYADFNRIEINNTGSTVIWNNVSISVINPDGLSIGTFEMMDNATTMEMNACIFSDMSTFTFLSNAEITGSSWNRCGQIVSGGATFTSCTFNESRINNDPSAFSNASMYCASGAEAALITNSQFISDGTGYGMEIDGAATNFAFTNVTWTDYAAQGGTAEQRAIHILATTGTFNITISGGTTPSYHSEGATVNINDNVVSTVTIKDGDQNLIENCAVAVFRDSDGFELANEFTTATGKVTFSTAINVDFTVRARKNSPGDTRYYPASQSGNAGASGTNLTITLIEDTIA